MIGSQKSFFFQPGGTPKEEWKAWYKSNSRRRRIYLDKAGRRNEVNPNHNKRTLTALEKRDAQFAEINGPSFHISKMTDGEDIFETNVCVQWLWCTTRASTTTRYANSKCSSEVKPQEGDEGTTHPWQDNGTGDDARQRWIRAQVGVSDGPDNQPQ